MIKTILLICLFLLYCSSGAQVPDDCCEEDSRRILNMFEKYKDKYIQVIKDTLLVNLIKNDLLRAKFEASGISDLDKFEYKINPVMYWSKAARSCDEGDNVCNLFDLDTIFYSCKVGLFIDTTLYFYCILGPQKIGFYIPDGLHKPQPSKFNFNIYFYKNYQTDYDYLNEYPYAKIKELFLDNCQLRFEVDGFEGVCYTINNYQMRIHSDDVSRKDAGICQSGLLSKARSKEIREYAKLSPSYEYIPSPWWQFWNWEVFH